MRLLTYLFLFIVILLGVTFACLNAELVVVNYYVGNSQLPLSLLLVLVLIVGCCLGLLGILIPYWKMKHVNRCLRNRLKLVEQEVMNLRTIPLKND